MRVPSARSHKSRKNISDLFVCVVTLPLLTLPRSDRLVMVMNMSEFPLRMNSSKSEVSESKKISDL